VISRRQSSLIKSPESGKSQTHARQNHVAGIGGPAGYGLRHLGDLKKAKETFDYGLEKDPKYPMFITTWRALTER
jgi:hypothetical protein